MKNNSLSPMPVIVRLLSSGVACGVLALFVVSGLLVSTLRAQETAAPPEVEEKVASVGKFPVKIVAGRLVAAVEISTIHRRIQANLFVDFESPFSLRLPDSIAKSLQTEDMTGKPAPVTIHFPEFAITLDQHEKAPEAEYIDFTRLHSRAINETPLIGSIGSAILSRYRVTFDLRNGIMELAEPAESQENTEAQSVPKAEGGEEIEVSTTTVDDMMWLLLQSAERPQVTRGIRRPFAGFPLLGPRQTVHRQATSGRPRDPVKFSEWSQEIAIPGVSFDATGSRPPHSPTPIPIG